MKSRELVLPANYRVDVLDQKLRMLVTTNIGGIEEILKNPRHGGYVEQNQEFSDLEDFTDAINTRLETELSKFQRFAIFNVHNTAATELGEALSEVGEITMPTENSQKQIDYAGSMRMTLTEECQRQPIGKPETGAMIRTNVWTFQCECDFTCEKKGKENGEIAFAEKVVGKSVRRELPATGGRALGGLDRKTVRNALTEAMTDALAKLALKLANRFPIGGEIKAISSSGETMMLSVGTDIGILQNQQMIIFVDDDGLHIPIAAGTAEPSQKQTRIAVRRWNPANKDASLLTKRMLASPKAFLKEYKVYAVGYGINLPPEWETFDRSNHAIPKE
ncbi:MAG: hypothetical protein MJ202_06870 [Lentisphaeria bacterium]|nr:hypothetical protein [Lentisphaeria bacterium]